MGIAHAEVIFQSHTKLPADEIVNSWTFYGSGSAVDTAIAADPKIQNFYNGTGGLNPILQYWSPDLDMADTVTKWYSLSETSLTTPDVHGVGTGFGSPILTTPWSPTGGSGTALPNQIAVAMSYHGVTHGLAEHSGPGPRPAARLRGRMYLGPFSTAVLDHDTGTKGPVVSTGFVAAVTAAGNDLITANDLTAEWAIWSRKNNKVYTIVGGFVDNRFDTQRRRDQKALSRGTFGAPG